MVVTVSGFDPNESLEVGVLSTYRKLADWTSDGSGNASGTLQLPADLSVGQHTIRVTGSSGRVVESAITVTTKSAPSSPTGSASPTLPITGASAGTLPLGIGALVLIATGTLLVWRRRLARQA